MPVTTDIVQSYRAPRKVLRRQIDGGAGEERALAFVMIACFISFVARWPELSRAVHLDPTGPDLAERMSEAFVGGVFVAPLFFYGLAAVSHLIAKLFGGQARWVEARLALFWALLAVSPLVLLRGLVAGFIGDSPGHSLVSAIAGAAFLIIWIAGLLEAEKPAPQPA
ncbi:YIP1 family protein [Pseudoruegeria sp. SHC-113]|uniref:YIP1 family protein n=1 Tax=Pseudoruegeria sp. SHC-113 TaxID=2855439 RepID=UPI0021BAA223|nr:YIP1 family protein [Pseudoruegeria sp. SHC-113]MCT8160519.1 YIP1 family protein [Pseudoruegeria sp. SHC-113]